MKLNLGCGRNKREGHINVDAFPQCEPDLVFDLETFPWPWEDNSVETVVFNHSLEHMGQESKVFLKIMQELYRVCHKGAEVFINVPHPRHDFFIGDPTHVRPITSEVLSLFSKARCEEWQKVRASNTPLALYLGVDFKMEYVEMTPDEPYKTMMADGIMTFKTFCDLAKRENNICTELRFKLLVRKQ